MAATGPSGPLDGLLVADFSRILAGPYCTMLLADLGATVIKVEGPSGDDTRHWKPPVAPDGTSTYFLAINRNKRSLVLDLADEKDLALAVELTTRADVVVQNFKPGGLARFGLDVDAVRARNPGVLYASISGFGAGGGAALPGYDLMVQALSGLMDLTGDPAGPGYRAGVAVFDVMAGLHTAVGILAALAHRQRTGEGQHIETNLLSSALSGLVNQTSAYLAGGVLPTRAGNAHPSIYPYEPFPTADGELVVIAANDGQFVRLCDLLGIPDVARDPRFAGNADRTRNRLELEPLLVERLSTRTAQEWFDLLAAGGVPCAPIATVAEGVAYAERLGLEPVVDLDDGRGAPVRAVASPIRLSRTPATHRLPPPALDADGDELRRWLGSTGPLHS
ncbi:MAG TPA: CoA transferase [Frankiaceae bacterium]|nr:CoA transferase [Frankiaceae bacterium]